MPCYRPARLSDTLAVPCGRCIGCRLDRAQEVAIRCVHEASLVDRSCFVTLTYAPEHLPRGGTLAPEDLVKFWKRLRRPLKAGSVRYLACGEYGEPERRKGVLVNPSDNVGRPHYHALLFGLDFGDKKPWKKNAAGDQLYTSLDLERVWGKGFCSLGKVTYKSAAYVARYALKKVTGEFAPYWYARLDLATGEVYELVPEFSRRSLRPGLGHEWLRRYFDDVYPSDEVVVDGRACKPPRYYDVVARRGAASLVDRLVRDRVSNSRKRVGEVRPSRRHAREVVKEAQVGLFKRS